ncbi:hypothetical protein Pfo_024848, partial [Paulownia fortunei]
MWGGWCSLLWLLYGAPCAHFYWGRDSYVVVTGLCALLVQLHGLLMHAMMHDCGRKRLTLLLSSLLNFLHLLQSLEEKGSYINEQTGAFVMPSFSVVGVTQEMTFGLFLLKFNGIFTLIPDLVKAVP